MALLSEGEGKLDGDGGLSDATFTREDKDNIANAFKAHHGIVGGEKMHIDGTQDDQFRHM